MKTIIWLSLFVTFLFFGLWGTIVYKVNLPLNIQSEELVTIKAGTSISSFSQELVKKGWINERFGLRNYVRIHRKLSALKAGTYLIQAKTTQLSLLKQLVKGEEHQFTLTFVEGSTLKQWLTQLKEHPYINSTLTKGNEYTQLNKYLNSSHKNLEGLFFPDTYAFVNGTQDRVLLKQAYLKMQKYMNETWKQKQDKLPYKSAYEALIMASIIEKESSQLSEYPIIASVFINRLRKKMRLQTDPTVIYGLGERYKGDITRKHLKEKTPYNTYRIKGLPPTPIAMPGLNAIQAAVAPQKTNFYYFVSNGEGAHTFSKNLKEHNAAVKVYLKKQAAK